MVDPDWTELRRRAEERYADGVRRLPEGGDERQRQLTRLANAAAAAGLGALMAGEEAREWLTRAAERYRESWETAPPESWGRPIGAIKARILSGDWEGAADDAHWALELGAGETESPIGRYAAALAWLVLGEPDDARRHADFIRTHDGFPTDVGDALAFIAAEDRVGYTLAVESVLDSFESRDEYLEDMPVADTVLVLQALAERRGMAAPLASELLPQGS